MGCMNGNQACVEQDGATVTLEPCSTYVSGTSSDPIPMSIDHIQFYDDIDRATLQLRQSPRHQTCLRRPSAIMCLLFQGFFFECCHKTESELFPCKQTESPSFTKCNNVQLLRYELFEGTCDECMLRDDDMLFTRTREAMSLHYSGKLIYTSIRMANICEIITQIMAEPHEPSENVTRQSPKSQAIGLTTEQFWMLTFDFRLLSFEYYKALFGRRDMHGRKRGPPTRTEREVLCRVRKALLGDMKSRIVRAHFGMSRRECLSTTVFLQPILPADLKDTERECPITNESYSDTEGNDNSPVKLPCSHMFSRHAILDWLDNSETCPMCRNTVLKMIEGPQTYIWQWQDRRDMVHQLTPLPEHLRQLQPLMAMVTYKSLFRTFCPLEMLRDIEQVEVQFCDIGEDGRRRVRLTGVNAVNLRDSQTVVAWGVRRVEFLIATSANLERIRLLRRGGVNVDAEKLELDLELSEEESKFRKQYHKHKTTSPRHIRLYAERELEGHSHWQVRREHKKLYHDLLTYLIDKQDDSE